MSMDREHHCPFLNRSDPRCSSNFRLDHLTDTYDYCFGQYAACPSYLELLAERRARRGQDAAGRLGHAAFWSGANGVSGVNGETSHHAVALVPLTHDGRRVSVA